MVFKLKLHFERFTTKDLFPTYLQIKGFIYLIFKWYCSQQFNLCRENVNLKQFNTMPSPSVDLIGDVKDGRSRILESIPGNRTGKLSVLRSKKNAEEWATVGGEEEILRSDTSPIRLVINLSRKTWWFLYSQEYIHFQESSLYMLYMSIPC